MTQYIAAVLALAAVVVGVRGNTWDDSKKGTRRLTRVGRWVLAVAVVSFSVSIVQTCVDQRRLAAQAASARTLETIAHEEIADAVGNLMFPFESAFNEVYHIYATDDSMIATPPDTIVALARQFRGDRFYRDPEYTRLVMTDTLAYWVFGAFDDGGSSRLAVPSTTWGDWFAWGADTCASLADRTQARLGSSIDAETAQLLRELTTSEVFQRLRMRRQLRGREDNYSFPLVRTLGLDGPRGKQPYVEFVEILVQLKKRLRHDAYWTWAPGKRPWEQEAPRLK
jgi:hypothetical protein